MKYDNSLNRGKDLFSFVLFIFMVLLPLTIGQTFGAPTTPASGLVSIPLKWVGIDGSPSMVDPTIVGEDPGDTKGVLWRRHERISEFQSPPKPISGMNRSQETVTASSPTCYHLPGSLPHRPLQTLDESLPPDRDLHFVPDL